MTTSQLRMYAASLGWNALTKHAISVPHRIGKQPPTRITWFQSYLPNDAFLQINLLPRPQAAVYALKFRLFTGWRPIPTPKRPPRPADNRLDRLHAKWFQTPAARAQFRTRYPECAGFTWDRVASEQLRKD